MNGLILFLAIVGLVVSGALVLLLPVILVLDWNTRREWRAYQRRVR
jgi:hypothetical protein